MKHNIQLVHGNIKFHLVCGGKRYNKNIAYHGLLRPRQEAPFITMCHGDTEQYLYTKDLGEAHFQVWEKVVASYSGCCSVERIAQGTYPCLSQQDVLMKYQPLSYKEIEAVVHKGETVPAGVTRFNISGRCLNLQVPLALLKQDDDVGTTAQLEAVFSR
ncbi:Siderophore staphylobactin biosynthesis protein SbnI [Staphylococcus aureus]|uniref:Siderophore staphylobactin biosynthesis protein SbnI n=1 Tax=Staphylococcus aureus TaxID=1280 RepID=A0A2X2JYA9_STAAU|nr:Siderophore staphylobactin biosynthesis protein SbnI [Staphylococcus aureus]